MTPFIHYNIKVFKTFQELLKKNNKNEILDYIDNNKYELFIDKRIFDLSCSYSSLEIVKIIYEKLQNKYLDFREALFNSINQNNQELFKWLSLKNNVHDQFNFIKYCILINNISFFKFLHKLNSIPLNKNNNELFKLSLQRGRLTIVQYILKYYPIVWKYFHHYYFIIACKSNNIDLIDFLVSKYDFLEQFQDNNKTKLFIFDLCKNGCLNSFKKLNNESMILHEIIKKNIYNIIYYVITSNHIEFTEYVLNLNYHNELNVPYLFEKALMLNNLKIIKLLINYQPDIVLSDYFLIENVLHKKQFKLFILILHQNIIQKWSDSQKNILEKIINKFYSDILMHLNNTELHLFYSFIKFQNVNIYSRECNLNKLLKYNQLEKIKLIEKYFYEYYYLDLNNIFNDCLESNNEFVILYGLEKLKNLYIKESIYNNKILEHAYNEGLNNLINKYDKDNNYQIKNYNIVFIKNILKNNKEVISKLLNKDSINIDLNNIFQYIINNGNIEIYEIIKKKYPYFKVPIKYIHDLIKNEKFHIFEKIINNFNKNELEENKEEYLNNISKYGNINFLIWYFSYFKDNISSINIEKSFYILIKHGYFSQAIYVYELFEDKNNEINLYKRNFELLLFIIKQNNLDMIKWFFDRMDTQNKIKFSIYFEYYHYIHNIIENDNVYILDYIYKLYQIKDKIIIKKAINIAFRKNKMNCLNYLFKLYNIGENRLKIDMKEYFLQALKYDNYELMDMIIKNNKEYNWLFISAINNQYTHFHYLVQEYKEYIEMNEELFFNLCFEGKVEAIKILLHYTQEIDFTKINSEHLSILISYDDLEMIKYLTQLNKNIDFNYNNCYLLRLSILLENDLITNWILNNIKDIDLHVNNNFLFKTVIYNQNFKLLKQLYNYSSDIDFQENNNYYLKLSSQLKNLDIFIWLLDKIENPGLHEYNDIYIKNACAFNNIELVKFLLDHPDFKDFDINLDNSYIIRTCFGYHYVELIQYLFERYSNINVMIENEVIMKYAIEDGDLELIKLLYNYCSNFDLSANNEYLFRTACKTNKLEIAKWLLSKKPDINYAIYNHEIFYFVCDQEYFEIAQFLAELDNIYEINIKEEEIISYSINKKLIIENSYKKVDNIENCPICFDHSELITNCSHQFCVDCLKNVNNKNIELVCPLCRTKIDLIYKIEKNKN